MEVTEEDLKRDEQAANEPEQAPDLQLIWHDEALEKVKRIPIAFIRGKVKQGLEIYAQRQGIDLITADVMKEALAGEERSGMFGKMPRFSKPD